MGYQSLAEMFFNTCQNYPEKTGIMFKADGKYQSMAFAELAKQVSNIAAGLAQLGVQKDENVIILSENSKEWAFCDYAILSNGAVTTPIYPTLLPKDVAYIINDSDAKVVIVSNQLQFDKLREVESSIPRVEKFILIDPDGVKHDRAISLAEVAAKGEAFLKEHPDWVKNMLDKVQRDNLATIIYTSGTTGEPKGVMLTHNNLLSNIEAALRALPVRNDDTFLSFLPLSHVFERMVGHFTANYVGATIAYAESVEKVPDNLQEVRPTIMASVPRLFEKIYAKVIGAVEDGSPIKKKLFDWAVSVGKEVVAYRQKNMPLPGGLKLKLSVADKLVFSKLRERVGGRIRFFVSGGAPLSREIGEFFTAAGLLIIEGYGLSETSPVITCNRVDKFKFGSVGMPFDNVEVKIAEDGEILTRGPHVMRGYYKKEADTQEAIDKEGWFHTGDIGHFDEDGMLIITDRKKNIIVTAGGKNVAPQKMEGKLIMSRYIEQAVVIGDKRKFCSALIVPSFENIEKFAQENNISYTAHADLCRNEKIRQLIQSEVDEANRECASYETIKKFILVDRLFSIDSGELTPSLKIKRRVVEKNFAKEIDALYQE